MGNDNLNDKLESRIQNLLEIRISPEQQLHLTNCILLWNTSEDRIKMLIGSLLGARSRAALVTADMTSAALANVAKNLANGCIHDPNVLKYTYNTISLFDALRARRNKIVHGTPVTEPNEFVNRVETRHAKDGTGQIKTIHFNIEEKSLAKLARDIAILVSALDVCIGSALSITVAGLKKFRPDFYQTVLPSGADVQKTLDRLSPRPPEKHKSPRRARLSPA